jgi:hypothetical protein
VVPHTKQIKTNMARCDAVAEVLIEVADVLLPNRTDSPSGSEAAAPRRNGAYASG